MSQVSCLIVGQNPRNLFSADEPSISLPLEWVILTNGAVWQLHHVVFTKPINSRLILSVDLLAIDWKKESQLEQLYPFTREGVVKGAHDELKDRQDATSRFIFAALLTKNESVLGMIRRELRKLVDVNVGEGEIIRCLENDVIKRDALEGPSAAEASARVRRSGKKAVRTENAKQELAETLPTAVEPPPTEVVTTNTNIALAPAPG